MAAEKEKKLMGNESTSIAFPENSSSSSHTARRIGTGISSVGSVDSTQPRRSMSVVGTTGYCGPEVFTGSYDEKCDIFSAGVILFVMLTGEMPFECKNVDPDGDSEMSGPRFEPVPHQMHGVSSHDHRRRTRIV
mmetsp:Transcript_21849/g.18131  ORF Transcript_21849/g.18131 Transcript_21849/m.18131 type:complete len:134 (+) Transcript_21849:1-402(+)